MQNRFESTNSKIDISFCLPIYNVKNFLEDSLSSIINQNFEGLSYEILCLDDCSNDGSYEYLLEKSKTIAQLKVWKNAENKGVSYTRNRLTERANGKYIWYVDPDDMLIKNVVKLFFDYVETLEADVLLGNYVKIAEEVKGNDNYLINDKPIKEPIEKSLNVLPKDQNGKTMCSICMGLFNRKFLLDNDLFLNENMIAQEDTLFYYEFSLKSKKIYTIDVPCYLYRTRQGSVMNRSDNLRQKRYYESMRELFFAYDNHLKKGEYLDLEDLKYRVNKMRQNVSICLSVIKDKPYIKNEIRLLKGKIEVYKESKVALKREGPNFLKRVAKILPSKLLFWLYNWLATKDKSK